MEHVLEDEATPAECNAVDAVLGPSPSSWAGGLRNAHDLRVSFAGDDRRAGRDRLLPALHALQSRIGWISRGGLGYVCRRLSIAPADAYGVASFYGLFALEARPPRVVHVCTDLACKVNGADQVVEQLRASEPVDGARAMSTWQESPCLGLCDRAPAALVIHAGDPPYEAPLPFVDVDAIRVSMNGAIAPEWAHAATVPQRDSDRLVLLRRVGVVDPASIDDYRAHGGHRALQRAFALGPAGVIAEVLASGLVGRGGAAFPTGRKWQAVGEHTHQPHMLVCNADESEPGTFKDRVVMEGDPFALVEALTIAGYATGCERGFIYLRGEYPVAFARLDHAIAIARTTGWLGDDIGGSGFSFDIEIRRGAGAYICGEETAIFNSIEGRRGEPRNKPPYPTDSGLFGFPTVVNNVETLVNVLPILVGGATAYAATGTAGSNGTKLFCISGCVVQPGVYEVEFGVSLRELLALAGGVRGGRALQGVLLGGAAGTFVRPDEIDLALTFEGTRAASASLGSGVILVLDDTVDLVAFLRRIAEFFRDESCGQCVPCRIGAVRQDELLERLAAGHPRTSVEAELTLLSDIGRAMRDASICGLGQTASTAIESAMVKFPTVPEAPMTDQPVAAPRRLIEITIDGETRRAPEGSTVLSACRSAGCDIPTLCYGDTLTPKNACRVCVVEVEGSRALVPSCSRPVEAGMVVHTDTERTRHSRRMVLEFLASVSDLSIAPAVGQWITDYDAQPERYGERATVQQPVKIDNALYVRDYAKCILCYKCVDACGEQWQNTFAIGVAGRGFDAGIATEWDVPLTDSACVYCGNCIAVCPTGALIPTSEFEMRAAGTWDEGRQTTTDTICPYCGVGCNLTLHVQDNRIVKVSSRHDHDITHGNLCIKGRFGFEHVQT